MILAALCLIVAARGAPYSLGHTTVTWSDPARPGRTVAADVWYPADVAGDDVPIADAPGDGFPVIAFGHGYLMSTARYQYLWEGLVPEGYVMALPTTGGELFPDHAAFALDLAFLVTRLEQEGSTPGSLFEGEISDLGAVGGHSMGGGASVLAAASATTLEAVFNLAAADTNPSAIAAAASVTAPSLMLAGSNDCVTPIDQHQRPIHDALGSTCKHLVVLDGASHCQFAEPDFFCNLGETCTASMSEAEQHALTLAFVRSWLGAILGADGSAWAEWMAALGGPGVLSWEGFCNPGPLSYCAATPNSTGLPAVISIVGSTSVAADDLQLVTSQAPANQFGLFFYGLAQLELPFGNGLRCVGGGGVGVQRLSVALSSAAGVFVHDLDYGAPPAPAGALLPGSTWNFQCWFRDPAAGGADFDLSDGLVLVFEP